MLVIGLHGPMQSGKDTASRFIHEWAEERGVFAVRRGFADLLKFSAARLFFPDISMADAVVWMDEFKFRGYLQAFEMHDEQHSEVEGGAVEIFHEPVGDRISGRELLQRYGTEMHRDVFDQDFWLDQLLPRDELARIRAVMRHDTSGTDRYPQIVTITDCRFWNEAQRILDIGGEVWRIVRPGLETGDTHISEAILPDRLVSRLLDNHRDLTEYRNHIRAFCEQLPVGD